MVMLLKGITQIKVLCLNVPAKLMKVRFAEKKDLNEIIDLCEAHAHYEKSVFNKTGKLESLSNHFFENPNGLKCIVVQFEYEIVGYATFIKQFSTWDANYYIYLDCLFLKEKTRGKGIGKQMMQLIKEYAYKEKCKIIQWQTPSFNKRAINFYSKLGAIHASKERFSLILI